MNQQANGYFSTVLFDRDGTLIIDKHYLADPAGVELITGCHELVEALLREKRQLFVVSNQSGIGRGIHTKADADACNARMVELLNSPEPPFAQICYCPHAPDETCQCRKPAIGMWKAICVEYEVDAAHTLMVGDKNDDLYFAQNAGLGSAALVLTGKGEQTAAQLGIGLAPNETYRVIARESRPGYPQIIARNCAALHEAILILERSLSSVKETHGA